MSDELNLFDDEPQYFVEVITKARVIGVREFEYFVKWWNYPAEDNTWEPLINVENCKRLLRSFWNEVGKANRKNHGPVGTEYVASKKWIEEEKRIFNRDFDKDTETPIDVEENKSQKKEKGKKREDSDEDDEDRNAPSTSTAPSRKESSVPRNKAIEISDNDSEDDKPLKKKTKTEKSKKAPVPERRVSFASTSVAPSMGGKDDSRRETENPLPTVRKYSGMKIPKTTAKDAKPGGGAVGFVLKSAPPLTADEINIHRPKQAPTSRITEELDLSNSDVYGSLFLPSQSHQEPAAENAPLDMDGAENFLETISSRSAAAALHPSELAKEASKVVPPPRPVINKWTWDGELFLRTDGELAERICNIRLEEIVDVNGDGFKFDLLMDGKDSLRFDQLSSTFEIGTILHALRRVDQFASLCHTGPEDRETLIIFKRYMRQNMRAARTPVVTDFGHVAEMILFPVESELSGLLGVPLSLTNHAMFIVALMPWVVPPSSYTPFASVPASDAGLVRRSKELVDEWSTALDSTRASSLVLANLHLLDFPKWLVNMVRKKPYCIWARSIEPVPKDYGKTFVGDLRPETAALLNVLAALEATNVGYKKDLNFVFVHVGALRTLNTLEALVERRCKRPEIRFLTYGQHNCVKPHLWGIQEIYPIGGVVTFTHAALLEDPFGAADLILKLDKHPLWVSYILPSALALFVRLSSHPGNPIEMFKTEPFRFGRILQLIDDGNISLLQCPSLCDQPKTASDSAPGDEWVASQFRHLVKSSTDIVEDCWRIYISHFSNKSEQEVSASLHAEIVADLIRMQMQPSIRRNYRRFVVIKSESESHIPWDKAGFEWHTLKNFSFRDDFFGKAPPPNAHQSKNI